MGQFISPSLHDKLNPNEYKKFMKQLKTVKARKDTLETKVQQKNREQLVDIMKASGDDHVELLGNVTSIPEALKVLGLSEQEY